MSVQLVLSGECLVANFAGEPLLLVMHLSVSDEHLEVGASRWALTALDGTRFNRVDSFQMFLIRLLEFKYFLAMFTLDVSLMCCLQIFSTTRANVRFLDNFLLCGSIFIKLVRILIIIVQVRIDIICFRRNCVV